MNFLTSKQLWVTVAAVLIAYTVKEFLWKKKVENGIIVSKFSGFDGLKG